MIVVVAHMRFCVVLALGVASLMASSAQAPIQAFLSEHFQLGAREFGELARREPVVKTLDSSEGHEVATLGVVQLRVPSALYIERLRDIVAFKKSAAVLQIGRFSDPATVDDLANLTLDANDLEDLRRCRPRSCGVQLSAEAVKRFREEVPWGTPPASAVATRIMREVLVDAVRRYRAAGDAGLMTYVDGDRAVSLASEFSAMVESKPAFLRSFPDLHRHLVQFPQPGDGIEDVIYWSKEKMGPAAVVGITHLAIAPLQQQDPATFAVASKQIYATHYFDASLGMTVLLQDAADASRSYLVYVNRSRIDLLKGFWAAVKRPIVRSRVRSATAGHLLEARDSVERQRGATAR
jgi:hypothetical protein